MAILKYPKHFYDPIRVEIAVSQIQHDLRKLLPDLSAKELKNLDKNIVGWFFGEDFELEPVHDFWNFFDGFSRGLKLKSLLSWITAENVVWEKKMVEVKNIIITWDFLNLDFIGKAPYKAEKIIKELNRQEYKELKRKLKNEADWRSKRYHPRDGFPIVLFDDRDGGVFDHFRGHHILEGNRRVIRAAINGDEKIISFSGKFRNKKDLWAKNYWISTGILRDLIFLAINYEKEEDEKSFNVVRNFYQLLLRDFDLARIATIDKSFKNFETSHKLQKELLNEDMR